MSALAPAAPRTGDRIEMRRAEHDDWKPATVRSASGYVVEAARDDHPGWIYMDLGPFWERSSHCWRWPEPPG
jgi:hypothetical protein